MKYYIQKRMKKTWTWGKLLGRLSTCGIRAARRAEERQQALR